MLTTIMILSMFCVMKAKIATIFTLDCTLSVVQLRNKKRFSIFSLTAYMKDYNIKRKGKQMKNRDYYNCVFPEKRPRSVWVVYDTQKDRRSCRHVRK